MIRRIETALLTAACLIPFVRLGIGEIQPWDESLYVIRAQACLKFGAWLDQTKYAVGGLYSSWHPPLGIWLIAISRQLFGSSTFAFRFPVAVAAFASILVLWSIVRRFGSDAAALVSVISFATSDLFLFYSHHAQLESFLLFFSLAGILFFFRAIERESWMQSLLSGLFLGCALQVKLGYGLYVIPILILYPWAIGKPRALRLSALSISMAAILMVPWFLIMSARQPEYWSFVLHSLTTFQTGAYAPSNLAWWYYANRLLVALPLFVTIFFVRHWDRLRLAFLTWLLLVAIVLQCVGTRMPQFAFLLLAPGALLIGLIWDRTIELAPRRRIAALGLSLLLISWSASWQVRLLFTHHLTWSDAIFRPVGIITILVAGVVASIAFVKLETRARYAVGLSVMLLGIALTHLFSEEASVFQDGAENVAAIAAGLQAKCNMVLIHSNFPHEQYAPQLAYYTGGWTLGWIPEKRSQTITWDSAVTEAYSPDSTRDIAVITLPENQFYRPPARETPLMDSLKRKLRLSFSNMKVFRSYVVFY